MTEGPIADPQGYISVQALGNALAAAATVAAHQQQPGIRALGNIFERVGIVLANGAGPALQMEIEQKEAEKAILGIVINAAITYAIPQIALRAFALEVGLGLGIAVGATPIATAIILFGLGWAAGEFATWAGDWLVDEFGVSFLRHDPLVLDLDLNGVALTSLNSSNAHFDFDMDGFAERTGWVFAGDGLLVRDLNGNGLIDNGGELFGNATQDGFAALAAFDLNADSLITAADPVWSDLRLWKDANQDGVTQTGEISTLAANGVVSIDLAAAGSREHRAGNSILFTGGFTLTGGL